MPMNYDLSEDLHLDPLVAEADVLGLYPADKAAAAAKWTTTIGTGDDD